MSVVPMTVKPKNETRHYGGHTYHLMYDPNAPLPKRWVWQAIITKKYEFVGEASTIDAAARAAKKRIDKFAQLWGGSNE
jgi:hypothetical protein